LNELHLHSLKKVEIVLEGAHRDFATDLLERAGVKGYTVLGNVSGKGGHGTYSSHLMFNEDDVLIMIVVAVPGELVAPILEGFSPFFAKHPGVMLFSDIQVSRLVKFAD
jgi:nitrogen regulatory protein PII